jgi:predicted PurR-regulated permease PerM
LLLFSGVYFGRDFLLPIILAFILSFLLAPAIRWLARMHIPAVLSSGVIIAGLLTVTVYGSYRLSEPAREWLQKAPGSFNTVRQKFRALLAPMEKARQTTKQIEKMAVLGKEDNVPTGQI